jgi:hypothetical protein
LWLICLDYCWQCSLQLWLHYTRTRSADGFGIRLRFHVRTYCKYFRIFWPCLLLLCVPGSRM